MGLTVNSNDTGVRGLSIIKGQVNNIKNEIIDIVIDVTEEDRYKLVSYAKEHLPIVTVVRDDGKEIHCTVLYDRTNKTILIEWNESFNGKIFIY